MSATYNYVCMEWRSSAIKLQDNAIWTPYLRESWCEFLCDDGGVVWPLISEQVCFHESTLSISYHLPHLDHHKFLLEWAFPNSIVIMCQLLSDVWSCQQRMSRIRNEKNDIWSVQSMQNTKTLIFHKVPMKHACTVQSLKEVLYSSVPGQWLIWCISE